MTLLKDIEAQYKADHGVSFAPSLLERSIIVVLDRKLGNLERRVATQNRDAALSNLRDRDMDRIAGLQAHD